MPMEVNTGLPDFSLVVPVWNPKPDHLKACIDSVIAQTYESWELILVCDGPQPGPVMDVLANPVDRVTVLENPEQGGIVKATNSGIEVARSEFVGFLDNDDLLAPFALESCAVEIQRWDDVDVIYTDEDLLSEDGKNRFEPFFKPAWSPDRLRTQNYMTHLSIYRRELIEQVGRLRPGFDGAQDHDLALRTTEQARRIVHVPRICYHWRVSDSSVVQNAEAKPWAYEAGVRAVQSAFDRLGIDATARYDPERPGVSAIQPNSMAGRFVSIVIPASGRSKLVGARQIDLLPNVVESIAARSDPDTYEVVVVLDHRATPEIVEKAHGLTAKNLKVIQDPEPFNFSRACNLGAAQADGDTLIFLNDDTEVITPNWLERLTMLAHAEGAGAVGARLLFPNGTLQHCGVYARIDGVAHRYYGQLQPRDLASHSIVNVSAVTGACLAITTERFYEVGAFTEVLPLCFNDVDLCFKLLYAGYNNILDGGTTLTHYESISRDPTVQPFEVEFLRARWSMLLANDPYDNPNYTGAGVEDVKPPMAVTLAREMLGRFHGEGRSWPFTDSIFNQPVPVG